MPEKVNFGGYRASTSYLNSSNHLCGRFMTDDTWRISIVIWARNHACDHQGSRCPYCSSVAVCAHSSTSTFFFLERAGELRVIVLIDRKIGPSYNAESMAWVSFFCYKRA